MHTINYIKIKYIKRKCNQELKMKNKIESQTIKYTITNIKNE